MEIKVKKEYIIFIAFITVFLAQLGNSMYLPALPLIAETLSARQQDIALSFPAFLIGMAVLLLLWGGLGEKYGRKKVLSIAILFYSACSLAIALVSNTDIFIFLRFLQGMAAGGMTVLSRIIIKDYFSGDRLAKILSWFSFSFVVSVGIGQFLGASVTKLWGWQTIFFSLTITALVLLSLFLLIKLPDVQLTPSSLSFKQTYFTILQCKPFLLPALAGALGYGIVVTFNTNAPFIFQTHLQWSAYEYGLLGWPISMAYFLGAFIVNRYVVKKGRELIILVGLGILLFGCTVMLLGSAFYLALLFWLPYCIALIGQAIIYPVSMSISIEKSPIGGGYPVALCSFIHQVMAATIGIAASMLPSQYPWLTPILMLCLAFGVVLCVLFSRDHPIRR
ncbi:MFS transporter [Xenorhabdus sp. 42]|uniref:MFS transporter n=1 Tax=Xenorhabdus szentirmaii TaxID=290112 RepID=UPI0019B0C8F6|nr:MULTISPECIES: MFS transporter [unclassified Xenorhabdus]MBD2820667.1 MFS transporter [Xenorhabdus sp. 42]MBD2824089.1 MFS transporter [Xenorhabdus sp. 5]